MTNLMLVHPLFLSKSPDEQSAGSPYFPLGLLYLAGYVRQHEYEVTIFDGTFEADESAFAAALAAESPEMVGISALLPTREMALKLAQMAHDSGAIVVMGGPEPTKNPRHYLAYPQVDLVVHHEGEQTLVALLELLSQGNLSREALQNELGVAFRDEIGQPVVNPPRPPIDNLDSLPLPARDLIDMNRYLDTWRDLNGYSSLTITTARGCPYGCEWCQEAVHGTNFRQRSPKSVAAEIKLLKERYAIDRLRVVDDVDGISREWLEEWAQTAQAMDAVIPFEALNELKRQDIPMLDVRDSL
ncbi:MAG: B12-binding domain-containing radical SAM protein [Ardenticatenaceae bacterium]